MEPRAFLRSLLDAAIEAALPSRVIPPALATIARPRGRTIVVGAGKASAAMAQAFERHWTGPFTGLVVTRYGHGAPCARIEIVEAAHPVPDEAGQTAARRMLDLVRGLTPDDLVVCLLSGGGSALLTLPAPGITLAEKQAINRELLRSGASIGEINVVRKHLSAIKGGRLGLACRPARVVSLVISDVPGDDPSVVASGPTLPDRSTREAARATLHRYGIAVPHSVRAHLESPASETPKPGDGSLDDAEVRVLASAQVSLEAAAARARAQGVPAYILSDAIEGEAREVARVHAAIARQVAERGQPFSPPCVLLSGGETTVTVRGDGRGGRNVEFLASLALTLNGHPQVHALAADTDGIDGTEPVAGAIVDPTTARRTAHLGRTLGEVLDANDAHSLFAALGDSVVTGPTLTNVNDFRAILVSDLK